MKSRRNKIKEKCKRRKGLLIARGNTAFARVRRRFKNAGREEGDALDDSVVGPLNHGMANLQKKVDNGGVKAVLVEAVLRKQLIVQTRTRNRCRH